MVPNRNIILVHAGLKKSSKRISTVGDNMSAFQDMKENRMPQRTTIQVTQIAIEMEYLVKLTLKTNMQNEDAYQGHFPELRS